MRAIFVQIKCDVQAYRVARKRGLSVKCRTVLDVRPIRFVVVLYRRRPDIGLSHRENPDQGVKDTYTLITFNAFSASGRFDANAASGIALNRPLAAQLPPAG
jgi:hypothetical protein